MVMIVSMRQKQLISQGMTMTVVITRPITPPTQKKTTRQLDPVLAVDIYIYMN